MFFNVPDVLQISCRYRLLGVCALTWTHLLRWNLFATGNRGGNVAVRRRWTRQLPDVGQFGFVSGTAAYPSARQRARVVQAALCVASSEVIPRWPETETEGSSDRSNPFPSRTISFLVPRRWWPSDDESWNFQSLHAERSFAESAVVHDEETAASSGHGVPEKSGQHSGKAQDV